MAVGSAGAAHGDFATGLVRPGAQESDVGSADSAAKFENALAHAPMGVSSIGDADKPHAGSADFSMDPRTLTAADDAWVGFLAISERLQNPKLSVEQKDALLKDLTENWRSFRSQSEPIARQLDSYIASQTGGAREKPGA